MLFMLVRGLTFGITMLYFISYVLLFYAIRFDRKINLTIQVMRFLYTYYTFILLFPCLQIFLFDVLCNTDLLTSLNETCRQGTHLLFWIMGFMGLIAAIFMTILKHWYSMNSRFDKNNAFAGENKKFEIIFTIIKSLLALLTALQVEGSEFKRFYVSIIFILSFFFMIGFIYYMPYTKKMVEYFCLAWIALFFTQNLTMVVYLIVAENEDWYISVHFAIYLIVITPTVLTIYLKRQDYLRNNRNIRSTAELIRQTYLYLNFNKKSGMLSRDEVVHRGVMQEHIRNCSLATCFCKQKKLFDPKKGRYISSANWLEHRNISMKLLIRAHLETRIRTNTKDADLLLLYAEFLFNKFRNTHLALYQVTKVSELGRFLSPSTKYKLFKLFYTITDYIQARNEETMDKNLEIENVIWIEDQFNLVIGNMRKIVQISLKFWGSLNSKEIHLHALNEKAQQLIDIVDQTTSLWNPLKPYLEKQKKMKYFYNWYLKDFLNRKLFFSEEDLENILEEDNVSVHSTDFINALKNDSVVFQEDSCVIQISGSSANLGKIIKMNKAIYLVFGYEKIELEGASVNILMPSAIARHHNGYIEEFVKTGESRVLYNQRLSYARHKRGYIFPIWIIVKQLSDAKGEVQYVGLLRPMRVSKEDESNYLLVNDFGEIQGVSKRLCQELHIDPVFASQSKINILMLAPKLIKSLGIDRLIDYHSIQNQQQENKFITSQQSNKESFNSTNGFAKMKSFESQQGRERFILKSNTIDYANQQAPTTPKNSHNIIPKFSEIAILNNNKEELTWDEIIELDQDDFKQLENDRKAKQHGEESEKILEFTLRIPKKLEKFMLEFKEDIQKYSNRFSNKKVLYNALSYKDSIRESTKSKDTEKLSRIFGKASAKKPSQSFQTSAPPRTHSEDPTICFEDYIHLLKKVSKQIITSPKEKKIFLIRAIISTNFHAYSKNPIKALKILSIHNQLENNSVSDLDDQGNEMLKSKNFSNNGSVNSPKHAKTTQLTNKTEVLNIRNSIQISYFKYQLTDCPGDFYSNFS